MLGTMLGTVGEKEITKTGLPLGGSNSMGETDMYTHSLNISQTVISVTTEGLRKYNRDMKERDINSNWANLSKQINSTAGAIKCEFKKKNICFSFNCLRCY